MKIRIHGDSIRFRLDRSETEAIGRGETVAVITHFSPDSTFTYQLDVQDVDSVSACFDGTTMELLLPVATARYWAKTESEVSINSVDGPLKLLIEKDFECLDPREGEDQSNRFTNPKAGLTSS